MSKHRQWQVSGWAAVLLAPVAIPIILMIKLAERAFGLKTTADLTASDVVSYLDDFISGRGGSWDWDDFTSIAITDSALESVRVEATAIDLPTDDAGEAKLRELLGPRLITTT